MNMSQVNSLEKLLDKLQEEHEYLARTLNADEHQAMAHIGLHIGSISEEIENLKVGKNSLGAKVTRWFRDANTAFEESFRCMRMKATESTLSLEILADRAFNLNLKEKVIQDEDDDGEYEEYGEFENPADAEKYDRIVGSDSMEVGELISDNHFDGLLNHKDTIWTDQSVVLSFKFTKKFLRDPEVMDQMMRELINIIWRKCLRLREEA